MAETYQLKHTGAQIDALLDKAGTAVQPTDPKFTELSEELANYGVLIEDLENMKIDKEADDYYPQLSVGTADNLAGVDEVASEFSFRRSGGGAITDGVARVQRIKGNSVVWNNLTDGGSLLIAEGTKALPKGATFVAGHKYALYCDTLQGSLYLYTNVGSGGVVLASLTGSRLGTIFTASQSITASGAASVVGGVWFYINGAESQCEHPKICDLTKMFGSGNEPTTIEEFYQRIPQGIDLNAYNEGEVISMRADGIKSVGRNQWNEHWELGGINSSDGKDFDATNRIKSGYIRILANTKYYFKKPQGIFTLLYFYDENKNYVGFLDPFVTSGVGGVFTTMDAPYMRFMVAQDTYHHDICINLSDTDYNGQYEPYIEDSEDLSIVAKYFPNGMRSAGSAHDEIRYNKASNRWEKVVRIAEVDLGSLAWDYVSAADSTYSMMTDALKTIAMASSANNVVGNILCSKFISDSAEDVYNRKMPESIAIAPTGRITIFASGYTSRDSVASFKAAMSGVMLYYELAEPIVTEIEDKGFNLDYKVWNCGTEQMVATEPSTPLAADITYGFNAVGLIKQLRSMIEALSAKVANL